MIAAKENQNSLTQSASEAQQGNLVSKRDQLQASAGLPIPSSSHIIHSHLQQEQSSDRQALANAALKAATEAASVALQQEDLEGQSLLGQSQVPLHRHHQQIHINSHSHQPALDASVLLNGNNRAHPFPRKMDIHDSTGTLLHQLGVNGEADGVQGAPQSSDAIHHNQQANQSAPGHEQGQMPQVDLSQQPQHQQQHAVSQQQQQGSVLKPVSLPTSSGITTSANAARKPTRMPGTKQCPTCQNTIAAALAKCPKCAHVFREKKEKVKRSGKRGKKNCPKCSFENPSACSSCKSCKYVFRLKLMDKYKQMRPRQTSDTAAAAAAAAAHAAANLPGQHAGVTAVSTVPMQAGVAAYPNTVGQPMHPGHAAVSVIPPLAQHPMSIHPNPHHVHTAGMPQMHPLPQHPMPHHSTHPQM